MQIPNTEFYTRILVGLLGVAFPILFQLVSKLDDKYSSSLVIELFDKEKVKKWFIWLLILSLVFVGIDTLEFTPLFFTRVKWLDYTISHSGDLLVDLSVIILVIFFFIYVFKILTYYTPNKFVKYLVKKYHFENRNLVYLQAIGDVFIHCIKKEYETLSITIWNFLIRENRAFKEKSGVEPIVYPDVYYTIQYKAIQELALLGNRRNRILEHKVGSQNLLLGAIEDPELSAQTYSWLWANVKLAISYKNDDLIIEYWKAAHQHCSFRFDFQQISPEIQQKKEKEYTKFIEFHIALGGLLLYSKRYECIDSILTYSSSQPPSYYLLPKGMNQIFKYYFKFLDPYHYDFSFISFIYPFPGLEGTNGDNLIKRWIRAYLILLFIRQYTLTENYVFENHLSIPAIPHKQSEKKFWINNIGVFEKHLTAIINDTELIKKLNFDFLTREWAQENNILYPIDFLRALKKRIEDSFLDAEINQTLFPPKVQQFKESSERILKNTLVPFLKLDNKSDISEEYTGISINGKTWVIDKDSLAENPVIPNLNFDTAFAEFFSNEVIDRMSIVFRLMKPKGFLFKQVDIFTAIDQLKLNQNFVIVAFGLNTTHYINEFKVKGLTSHSYQGIEIISFSHRLHGKKAIFILPRNDLPKIVVKDVSQAEQAKYGLTKVLDELKIYVAAIDLNINNKILEETIKSENKDQSELIKSALLIFTMYLELRWKNNAKIIQFSEYSEFEKAGLPNNLREIHTFEEMFDLPMNN